MAKKRCSQNSSGFRTRFSAGVSQRWQASIQWPHPIACLEVLLRSRVVLADEGMPSRSFVAKGGEPIPPAAPPADSRWYEPAKVRTQQKACTRGAVTASQQRPSATRATIRECNATSHAAEVMPTDTTSLPASTTTDTGKNTSPVDASPLGSVPCQNTTTLNRQSSIRSGRQ